MRIRIIPDARYILPLVVNVGMSALTIYYIITMLFPWYTETAVDIIVYSLMTLIIIPLTVVILFAEIFIYYFACRRITITDDRITQGNANKRVLQWNEIVDYGIGSLFPGGKRTVIYVSNIDWSARMTNNVSGMWELCAYYGRFPKLYKLLKKDKNTFFSEEAFLSRDRPVVIWWRYSDKTLSTVRQMVAQAKDN